MLRRAIRIESSLSRIRKAVNRIRQFPDQKLSVGELADIAGMSVPSFHRHFKAATMLSPLQYQTVIACTPPGKCFSPPVMPARLPMPLVTRVSHSSAANISRLFGMSPFRTPFECGGC